MMIKMKMRVMSAGGGCVLCDHKAIFILLTSLFFCVCLCLFFGFVIITVSPRQNGRMEGRQQ